ncbi:group-specific protein [Psychrobacillus glaciei]|uniref:Group-specific protein n=1 Tax=Psychrobacillus glaciei TaxID=2283160 RepID=A0A5J6SII2_9BACI|nr:nucleoside 2-deoxyribosyltransferase [Psychrobacillus glaciei]QFF97641.1 group-specific protein [Psychrobacillus glaciei]
MKFYVGSGLKNKEQVREVGGKLKNIGWNQTFDWTHNEQANNLADLMHIGTQEKEAIKDADYVIILLPGGKGSHIELGMAIALQKQIFLYSPHGEAMDMETTSTFYHLPEVNICTGSVDELISVIQENS